MNRATVSYELDNTLELRIGDLLTLYYLRGGDSWNIIYILIIISNHLFYNWFMWILINKFNLVNSFITRAVCKYILYE